MLQAGVESKRAESSVNLPSGVKLTKALPKQEPQDKESTCQAFAADMDGQGCSGMIDMQTKRVNDVPHIAYTIGGAQVKGTSRFQKSAVVTKKVVVLEEDDD